jgi:hypothetical protein
MGFKGDWNHMMRCEGETILGDKIMNKKFKNIDTEYGLQ